MQERKIPVKNYIIFILMTVAVIGGVLYTANYYVLSRDYYVDYSAVSQILLNTDEASFENYVNENPEVVLYIADSKDATMKNFEKKFKKLIINNNIKEGIIYLDSSKIDNENFSKDFARDYLSSFKITKLRIPNLIYFKDGEVSKILYRTDKEIIGIDDVQSFLIECEVIDID